MYVVSLGCSDSLIYRVRTYDIVGSSNQRMSMRLSECQSSSSVIFIQAATTLTLPSVAAATVSMEEKWGDVIALGEIERYPTAMDSTSNWVKKKKKKQNR